MGDHGHRIGAIQYSFVGRVEERATFFSIFLPQWFKKQHPKIVENFELNQYRLTSNYDVYQTLQAIIDEKFESIEKPDPNAKGVSLFWPISSNRSCLDANVPENHSLCMIEAPNRSLNSQQLFEVKKVNHKKIESRIQDQLFCISYAMYLAF